MELVAVGGFAGRVSALVLEGPSWEQRSVSQIPEPSGTCCCSGVFGLILSARTIFFLH